MKILYNALIATFSEELPFVQNGAVVLNDTQIIEVGESETILAKYSDVPAENKTDCGGRLVLPGLVVAHGHFYGMYSRGMDLHAPPPHNFMETLERLWWRLDRALDMPAVRHSVRVGLVDALKAGATTILDHHASPSAVTGSLDAIAEEVETAGLRCSLSYEVTERNGPEHLEEGILENVRFMRRAKDAGRDDLHGLFGLHACLTLTPAGLKRCTSAVREAGLEEYAGYHVHVAEGLDDGKHTAKVAGKSPVAMLHAAGMTGRQSIFAHCVGVDDSDIEALRSTDTMVVHNPSSNMNNAVGVAPVARLLDAGLLVGLGTDGMSNDIIQEHKFAYLLHKHHSHDSGAFSVQALDVIRNNGRIASRLFGRTIGQLCPGAVPDVLVTDYIPPTPLGAGSLPWHFMFGLRGGCAHHLLCKGQFVVREGTLVTLDPARIMKESSQYAPNVWAQIPKLVEMDNKE